MIGQAPKHLHTYSLPKPGLCNVVFSFFSLQPLTILGVTGPFSVIAENLYTMITDSMGVPFLPFMVSAAAAAAAAALDYQRERY